MASKGPATTVRVSCGAVSGREVQGPDGLRWVVRRRWAPRLRDQTIWERIRSRYKKMIRRTGDAAGDVPDPGCIGDLFDDLVPALIVLVAVVVVGAVLFFFLIPMLLILMDLILLLLLTVLGILGKIVFRRPWTIEASCDNGDRRMWKVVGWRASGAHLQDVAQHLEAGIPFPGSEPTAS